MKRLYLLLALILTCGMFGYAAFPTRTCTAVVDVEEIDGNWAQFDWKWFTGDDVSNTITITQSAAGYDLSSGNIARFRLSYMTTSNGWVSAYTTTNITIATSNLKWQVAASNMPSAGPYYAEISAWAGSAATTNTYRTLGQGKVRVLKSLQ